MNEVIALATDAASDDIDVVLLVVQLFGGLALFMLGMDRLTEALRLIAGARMRDLLGRLAGNRVSALLTGAGVTAVIQSSTVTTVLVVGFISSGLMTLTQSIGVIIGANVGTTLTAQVIAFKITDYALLAVAAGFAITFLSKNQQRQARGTAILGLGLVFFGMDVMGDAMSPLRSSEDFIETMARLENPLLGIAAAALFTALVQSSSATTGIVIVLAQQGLIGIETGVPLILGANIGTTITVVLAAIGKPRDAARAAAAHAFFNVVGVVIWLPFVGRLAQWVDEVGGSVARQVANAHTVFNVVNALLFIWFVPQIASLVTRLVPDRDDDGLVIRAKHLDRSLISTPELALAHARLEIGRMATRTHTMLDRALPALIDGTRWQLLAVREIDDEVDALHQQIIGYLREVGAQKLAIASNTELTRMMDAANNLEAAADIVETNLVELGLARVDQGIVVSPETQQVIEDLHAAVVEGLEYATKALLERDGMAARHVERLKAEISSMERSAALHQNQRLLVDAPSRVANYRFEIDVIANLKRIHYFSTRTARAVATIPKLDD